MFSDILEAIKDLDFARLNEIIANIDALELVQNPYVIAFMVICCIIFVVRGMEKALVTFLSAPAFLILFQQTVSGTSALDFQSKKLLMFVGGFLALAAINIYFYFVRK
jgi:hypothetical protein